MAVGDEEQGQTLLNGDHDKERKEEGICYRAGIYVAEQTKAAIRQFRGHYNYVLSRWECNLKTICVYFRVLHHLWNNMNSLIFTTFDADEQHMLSENVSCLPTNNFQPTQTGAKDVSPPPPKKKQIKKSCSR